jgi:hypothetical protein
LRTRRPAGPLGATRTYKDVTEVMRNWERAIDKAFDLKDWR